MTSDPVMTPRLTLRPHHDSDAGPLHSIYSQPAVARYLLDDPWTIEDARTKTAERLTKTDLEGPSHALALVIELAGEVIGDVVLWYTDAEQKVAEIGWVLDPDFGGRGYATEAASAVLDLAFDRYQCHRVVAQMDARNAASAKLAQRVGMTKEAHHRQDWYSKGEWTDTLIYAMLHSDHS